MFPSFSKKILLGTAVFSLGAFVNAAEILLWQIPENKGNTLTFHQDASKSSKSVSTFKPQQTVQVLCKKKEWSKIGALDNSGHTAWVPASEVQSITTVTVNLKQTADSYHCQVLIRDPKGREIGNWRLASRVKEYKGTDVKEQAELEKVFTEFDEALIKQQAALLKMMGRLSSTVEEAQAEISPAETSNQAVSTTTNNKKVLKP